MGEQSLHKVSLDVSQFGDPARHYVVILFVSSDVLPDYEQALTALSTQKNVRLVVQLCPFEGIEFLYRIQDQLHGHFQSLDVELFWEAIEIKPDTPKDIRDDIADTHLRFLTSILKQDVQVIAKNLAELATYADWFMRPLN